MADGWDKAQRLKRGGGQEIVSFDGRSAEERYRLEPVDHFDAAKLYERRWITTLFDKVVARLEQEFRDSGKSELCEELESSLLADNATATYAEMGARLGMKEDAVKQAVHRMRRRYCDLFREEIAQTVAGPDEVDDELKHLFAMLNP